MKAIVILNYLLFFLIHTLCFKQETAPRFAANRLVTKTPDPFSIHHASGLFRLLQHIGELGWIVLWGI